MFLYLPQTLDFSDMSLYNKHMNDTNAPDLEPVNVEELFAEFSDTSMAELMLTIKELRERIAHEQKLVAAKEFKLNKAESEIEELTTRINNATEALHGADEAETEED
jgi:hypothetical protein